MNIFNLLFKNTNPETEAFKKKKVRITAGLLRLLPRYHQLQKATFILILFPLTAAAQYMSHEKIMDGFTNRQHSPQMAGPVPYEKKSKLFPGKHGKLKDVKKKKKKGKK